MLECMTFDVLFFLYSSVFKKKILYCVICIFLLISSTCCFFWRFNTCSI